MCRFRALNLFVFLLAASTTSVVHAYSVNQFNDCGDYYVTGQIKKGEGSGFTIVVFAGSNSETILSIKEETDSEKLASYEGNKVGLKGTIAKKFKLRRGEITFNSIENLIPNPLDPNDGSGLKLIRPLKCL